MFKPQLDYSGLPLREMPSYIIKRSEKAWTIQIGIVLYEIILSY